MKQKPDERYDFFAFAFATLVILVTYALVLTKVMPSAQGVRYELKIVD